METCYKVFRREVIQSVTIEEDRFGFEPEVTAKVAQADWRVYEVGISYNGRTYAEGKKIGWRDGVRAVVCILKYSRTGARLRPLGTPVPAASSVSPRVDGATDAAGADAAAAPSGRPDGAADSAAGPAGRNGARPGGGDRSPV
jgi:hypothetical protein